MKFQEILACVPGIVPLLATASLVAACGSSVFSNEDQGDAAAGNNSASGGATHLGGVGTNGGASANAGATSTGGAGTAAGGLSGIGGATNAGGVTATSGGVSSGLGGTQPTGGVTATATTDDCNCLRGAYGPVCGNDGKTYDAICGDSCVPVPIACRGECPCAGGTGGSSSVGGATSTSGGTATGGVVGGTSSMGGATGTGAPTCSYNGSTYNIGDLYQIDSCNYCECAGTVAPVMQCTNRACVTGGATSTGGASGSGGTSAAGGTSGSGGTGTGICPTGQTWCQGCTIDSGVCSTGACPDAVCAPCSTVTTLDQCEARIDCHSIFEDPGTCGCATVGCCARFSRCAQGDKAQCSEPAGINCDAPTPYCEGPAFVNAYDSNCYDGCVQSKDCAD